MRFSAVISSITILMVINACNTKQVQKDLTVHASAKECIDYVIDTDKSLGAIRNHACEKKSLSETIDDYVHSLDNLSFSNCPPIFIKAFEEHKEAWVNVTEMTDQYPDLRGEMHDIFEIIEAGPDSAAFKYLEAEIWATWEQVELAINLE